MPSFALGEGIVAPQRGRRDDNFVTRAKLVI
jgi:hypothetical protein